MAGQYFFPAIPSIAQAYVNDPRTKLAMQAQQDGASTAPVAGGKWAWASGLGRIGSGIAGAIEARNQARMYDDKQPQVMNEVAAALAAALGKGAAGPQQGGVGAGPAAGGTMPQPSAPPPVPRQAQNNPPPVAPPVAPPQAPPPPVAPNGAPPSGGAPSGPPGGFDALGRGAPQAPVPGRSYNPADAVAELGMSPEEAQAKYGHVAAALTAPGGSGTAAAPFPQGASLISAMLPITASTESKGQNFGANGQPVTSPKGAKFAMQVMPATAANPGFGIAPAKDNSPAEYNRVGTELLGKLTEKYGGDPAKAWAAYNCGTGRVDHALAQAQQNGGNWLDRLPQETQAYVAKNCAQLGTPPGGTLPAGGGGAIASITPTKEPLEPTQAPPIPGIPNAPQDRGAVQSLNLDDARKLISTKDPFLYEQAMGMLDKGNSEQLAANQKAQDVLNNRDNALYSAGIDEHYKATDAQRQDAYATGREMRGYAHEDNSLAQQEAFANQQRLGTEQFTSGENALNRTNALGIAAARLAARPIPPPIEKELTDNANNVQQLNDLISRYKPEYSQGTLGSKTIGEANNWIGAHIPGVGNKDQAEWWMDYNKLMMGLRHSTFGSRLTKMEQQLWEKATATPGNSSDVVQQNLQRQLQLTQGVLARQAQSAATTYNPNSVRALLGPNLLPDGGNSAVAASPSAPPAPKPVTLNGKQYVKQGNNWIEVQ